MTSEEAARVLRALPLFAGVSEEAIHSVAERTIMKNVPRNRQLFRRGEACHGLYVVVRGRIKVYRATPDGREQVLHVEGPGRPVAELPLFDGGSYPASGRPRTAASSSSRASGSSGFTRTTPRFRMLS